MSGLLEALRAKRLLPSPARARAIRREAGVTQQRLADELGVDRVTVARWETGTRRPRGEMLTKYAMVLRTLEVSVLTVEPEAVGA